MHLGYKYARCKLKAVKIPGVDYIVWMVMDFGNIQLVKKTIQGNSYYYADAVMNNYREE